MSVKYRVTKQVVDIETDNFIYCIKGKDIVRVVREKKAQYQSGCIVRIHALQECYAELSFNTYDEATMFYDQVRQVLVLNSTP